MHFDSNIPINVYFCSIQTSLYRFPYSKGDVWENLFPSPTMREEIKLVDALIKYNPKKRLTANKVCHICIEMYRRFHFNAHVEANI